MHMQNFKVTSILNLYKKVFPYILMVLHYKEFKIYILTMIPIQSKYFILLFDILKNCMDLYL